MTQSFLLPSILAFQPFSLNKKDGKTKLPTTGGSLHDPLVRGLHLTCGFGNGPYRVQLLTKSLPAAVGGLHRSTIGAKATVPPPVSELRKSLAQPTTTTDRRAKVQKKAPHPGIPTSKKSKIDNPYVYLIISVYLWFQRLAQCN